MPGQFFQRRRRVFGTNNLHHFNFFKLVLTDQPACVLAVRAGFRAKTWRVRDPLKRQFIFFKDFIAAQICHRHLSRRYQVIVVVADQRKQILFKLRQLPGPAQTICVGNIRHINLLITMLMDLHVQHETDQRTLQLRKTPEQHSEAAARKSCRRFVVHKPQSFTDRNVVFRVK